MVAAAGSPSVLFTHSTCSVICVFVADQSRLTGVAKALVKICKQEMAEIENCPDCYLNAHTRKDSWFIEVCVSTENNYSRVVCFGILHIVI